jgi:hypothetical protein
VPERCKKRDAGDLKQIAGYEKWKDETSVTDAVGAVSAVFAIFAVRIILIPRA